MAKTVLITGATGLLGRQVVKAFSRAGWEVKGTGFTRAAAPLLKLDLNKAEEISAALNETRPDVVVHCAANRFPDKCDSDPEGTKALNVNASASLAHLCAEKQVILIYISTDYVFPGTEGDAPYQTSSTPNPPNLYGQTKLDGESAVLEEYIKAGLSRGYGVVLRVPVLYGQAEENKESAVNVLMDTIWKAQEKDASIVMDHWALRFPTNTEDVARVIKDVATKYLETDDRDSLPAHLQFSSEDKMTKYEICELLAEIMGLPLDGLKANAEGNDPKAKVQRPYDCHLSSQSLVDLGINVSTMDFTAWWRREARAFRK